MLRLVVVVLLLANVLSWAYSDGLLGFMGLVPKAQREPQRMEQQVNPEKLRLLQPNSAPVVQAPAQTPAQTPAPGAVPSTFPDAAPVGASSSGTGTAPDPTARVPGEATTCWLAPGFSRAESAALRAALEQEPTLEGAWQFDESVLPARWIVYLGPFPNNEELQRRRAELREARVDHREVNNPALQPGLALGTYSSTESAQQALRDVRRKGFNNVRVEQERPDTPVFALRLPAATASQKARVDGLGALLANRTLQACP